MKAAVVVFPGSNREHDVATPSSMPWAGRPGWSGTGDSELPKVDLIVVPGGFSYGDYLRCGAMAAHSPVMREVKARAKAGVAVLGICNGFQILTEAGLLPGALLRNAGLRFVCRNVGLKVETSQSLFTAAIGGPGALASRSPITTAIISPIAATLDRLEERGQIAFRYCDARRRARRPRPIPTARPGTSPASSTRARTCWA